MKALFLATLFYKFSLLSIVAQAPLALESNMDILHLEEVGDHYRLHKINTDTTIVVEIDNEDIRVFQNFKNQVLEQSDSIDLYKPYQASFKKVEPLKKHLIIIGEGLFQDFPFAALSMEKPLAHENYTQHDYLIKRHTLTFQRSQTSWEQMLDLPIQNEETVILLEDKENFEDDLVKEGRSIRDDFGGKLSSLDDIDFFSSIDQSRLLHVALESSIDTKVKIENEDISTSAEMISLSLCTSTISSDQWIDGLIDQGVKSCVYNLWPVLAPSRRQIINEYYKRLFDGERKNDALQNAQKRYLSKTTDVSKAHPYYWAGWRLYGDIKSVNNTVNPKVYLIIIALMLVFYYLIKRAKVKIY